MNLSRHLLLATLLLPLLAAADSPFDAGQSRIEATFTQIGVPVTGRFTRFAGSLAFDPAQPAAAHAKVEVETASFDLGDEDYNAEVRKPEWFDSARHPKAVFETTAIKPAGGSAYEATGTLSLKGRRVELRIPVTLVRSGDMNRFDGTVPISRAAFGIGDAQWKDTVEDIVNVRFHVVVPAKR